MRSIHTLVFVLAFLAGCANRSRAPERDLPPPPRAEAPSAGTRTDAALAASPEITRTFRSALGICYDAALKVCRDRDYRIVQQQPSVSISAHAPAFDLMLTFSRTPDNRTRVTIRRNPDGREPSRQFLDWMCDALLEPKE